MTQITARVTARRMTRAALALLDAFDQRQRRAVAFAMPNEEERRRWAYYPREFHGLPLLDMTAHQQKLVGNLLEGGLSVPAQAKVVTIMALESVLDRLESHSRDYRDPGRYFLSIFGEPGGAGPWAWRFEGHHVSLHFAVAGDDLVGYTPSFLGANPARVSHSGAVVVRPLAEEEDLARDLLMSLDDDQRRRAIVSPVAPPDFVLTNAARVPDRALPGELLQPDFPAAVRALFERFEEPHRSAVAFDRQKPLGLPGSELDDTQRDLLFRLLRVYLDRLPDDASSMAVAELEDDATASLYFAWAGGTGLRQPHYYRLQGPRFLVEYDNTQNNANHVHTVWRDPDNDFGDLLLQHYLDDHAGR